jgi:O-antigen/teichoic acid export membrane protein
MIKRVLYSKLFQNAGVYTVSNIVNSAIPFLLLPVLTRYLTNSDYGIIATFQALLGFLMPFIGLNTQTAITRRYYDSNQVNLKEYVSTCILTLIISTIIFSLVIFIFSGPISNITEFPANWLWSFLVVAFFQFIVSVILGIWQARGQVYKYALFQNSQTLINLVGSIGLIILLEMSWQGRIVAQIVSFGIFGILALVILKKLKLLEFTFNKKYFADALKFSLPLIPYSFTGWVLLTMDRIFLNNMVGLGQTGLYSVAFQVCMVITLFQLSFNNAWVPWIYQSIKKNNEGLNRKIVLFSYSFIAFNFLIAFFVAVLGPYFFKLFLGREFAEASNYLLWIALAQAANAIHIITVSYISYHNKNIVLVYSSVLTAIIHIPLTYFLIRANNATGAGQALFISNLLMSFGTFFLATRFQKMPWLLGMLQKRSLLGK